MWGIFAIVIVAFVGCNPAPDEKGRTIENNADTGGLDTAPGGERDTERIDTGPDVECTEDNQCESGVCEGGECLVSTCSDDVQNGAETDVDCGGPDCEPCDIDANCEADGDCQSGICGDDGTCQPPTCSDGVQNGDETDVDCGGSNCEPCENGDSCGANDDCQSPRSASPPTMAMAGETETPMRAPGAAPMRA